MKKKIVLLAMIILNLLSLTSLTDKMFGKSLGKKISPAAQAGGIANRDASKGKQNAPRDKKK